MGKTDRQGIARAAQVGVLAGLAGVLVLATVGNHPRSVAGTVLWGMQLAATMALAQAATSMRERAVRRSFAAAAMLLVLVDLPAYAATPGAGPPSAWLLAGAVGAVALLLAGQMTLLRAHVRSIAASAWLDLLAGCASTTALVWALLGGPLQHMSGLDLAGALQLLVLPSLALVLVECSLIGTLLTRRWRDPRMLGTAFAFALLLLVTAAAVVLPLATIEPDAAYLVMSCGQVAAIALLAAVASQPPLRDLKPRDEDARAIQIGPALFIVIDGVLLACSSVRLVPAAVSVMALAGLVLTVAKLGVVFQAVTTLNATRRQVETDDLTGLGNRRALVQQLRRLEPRRQVALALIDLDHFKDVNDSFGHSAGDALLRQVAARLASLTLPHETLVRLAGDEFVVLLHDLPVDDVLPRCRRIAAELAPPFDLPQGRVHLRASVGVTVSPQHGPRGQLLHRSDVAMHEAKKRGGGVALYDLRADDEQRQRLKLAEELRTAVFSEQIVVYYQPQVDIGSGALVGVEALVRWHHPRLGLLTPADFLPLAERHGLMFALTHNVMSQALDACAAWRALPGHHALKISVNLSASSMADPKLVPLVEGLLDEYGLGGDALLVEITETELMLDARTSLRAAVSLARLGVQVSIDDYGTGYSSLAYLRDLPAAELKVDRSFVAAITSDPRTTAIVRSTIDLAHSLGLRLVAEGVEDDETLRALRDLGADVSQGYHHSRPVPRARFEAAFLQQAAPASSLVP